MVALIVFGILGLALVFVLFFLLKSHFFSKSVIKQFQICNVLVDGKKGKGKDLLFQYVINKRKDPYYANISYGGSYNHVEIRDLSVEPNTYKNFIEGKLTQCKRRFAENTDFYISDAGNFLPSSMDSVLWKLYPSFPAFYSLGRHISNSNVHCNAQVGTRLWKAVREQADYFVHVQGHIKLPFVILIKCICYDKESTASRNLSPMRSRVGNKYSKAELDKFKAENGEIRQGWIILRKKDIHYDTRAFEKILFGDQPRIERPKKQCFIKRLLKRKTAVEKA